MASEAGKGSAPRKARDDKSYGEGWDRIFKKKKEEPSPTPPQGTKG